MIRDLLRSLSTRGSFTRNVAVVGSGKTVVAIIGFMFLPVISRLYTPEAYGIFSFYYAIVTFLAMLFTLSYPSAMVIVKDEKSFYNLFGLALSILLTFTLVVTFPLLLFKNKINSWFSLFADPDYMLFIPVGILLNGAILILVPWNIRRRQFVYSSKVGAGHNLLIRILNVIIGLLYRFNNFGLILGNQIGRFVAVILYSLKNIPHELKSIRESLSVRRMLVLGRNYKNYPLFILPSQILENLKGQSAVYFIGIGFNKMILGNFSISISVLSGPIQILANSISAVFLEKANDLYQNDRSKFPAFVEELIKKLFLIGLLPFSLLVALGERIIILFLGDEWEMAGEFSSILGPYFFVMLLISPILSILQILRKEREILFFNIIGFGLNILSLAVGYFFLDIILLVTLFSISNLLIYTAQGIFILRLVKLSAWKLVIGIFIIFPISVVVIELLALLIFG